MLFISQVGCDSSDAAIPLLMLLLLLVCYTLIDAHPTVVAVASAVDTALFAVASAVDPAVLAVCLLACRFS